MIPKIFFDLEFSDLKSTAMLVSAGFVDEQNNSLYVEVEPEHWQTHASQFVFAMVTPLLRGDGLPANLVTAKIGGWLNSRGPELLLVSDSNWDMRILRWHFKQTGYSWPFHWQWDNVQAQLNGSQRRAFNSGYIEWFLRSERPQHQALNDAQALRDAYFASMSAQE